MKRLLPRILVLLILFITFPAEWVASLIPGFNRWFDAVISPPWVHVVIHFSMFTSLSIVAIWLFEYRKQPIRISQVLTVVMAVAFLQEALQMLGGRHGLGGDELLDFGVDLIGGTFGYALYYLASKLWNQNGRSRPKERPFPES